MVTSFRITTWIHAMYEAFILSISTYSIGFIIIFLVIIRSRHKLIFRIDDLSLNPKSFNPRQWVINANDCTILYTHTMTFEIIVGTNYVTMNFMVKILIFVFTSLHDTMPFLDFSEATWIFIVCLENAF